jgi:UDP-GlcNAc:undecaprenyl-phosphate GlcNAc-1-phosphate transferase
LLASSLIVTSIAVMAAVGVLRRVAINNGYVAAPNPVVSSHSEPVALLGGTALFVAFTLADSALLPLGATSPTRSDVARLVGVVAFVVLGTWDDVRPLGPGSKFAGEVVAVIVVIAVGGTQLGLLDFAVLLIAVNIYNFVDVMDGLLCTLAVVGAGGLLLAPGLLSGHPREEVWLLVAGLAGVFAFNHPPARVYLGDAGSLTIGFLIGSWWLEAANAHGFGAAAPAIAIAAIPLLELALIVGARLWRGVSPFRASADHFALRLQNQLNWTRTRVLIVSAVVGSAFASLPLVLHAQAPLPTVIVAVASLSLALLLWVSCWILTPDR